MHFTDNAATILLVQWLLMPRLVSRSIHLCIHQSQARDVTPTTCRRSSTAS